MTKRAPDFDKMTAGELNDWYKSLVGYRPQVDDPSMSDGDLRKLCRKRWDAEFGS